ncbi:MAG: DUF3352 domain-containing protein [Chloroflexota bacterium]|nr:DUF3352 domain-containing protein [Chloroflexota bacterium]
MSDQEGTDSPAPVKSDGSIFSRPAATTAPVAAPTTNTPTSQPMTLTSRWRWAVVGVATVLVVGLLGAAFVLGRPGGGTPSTVARYAPANTVTYLELNETLPGDQHNLVAQFMSHFPGFADQAAFDTKLDETLQSIFDRNPAGVSWSDDVKPWFGGLIGIFGSTLAPASGTPRSMTVALLIKQDQRLALEAWLLPLMGSDWQQSTYQGSTIWSGQMHDSSERVNLTWSDEALVVSTRVEDLQAALDVRADRTPGLADDQFFVQQLGALHADRLGTFYFDGSSMAQTLYDQLSTALPSGDLADSLVSAVSVRVLGEVRADGDHLTITSRTTRGARSDRPATADLPPLPSNRSSTLAELAPKDALLYAEVRDVGQTISWIIAKGMTALPSASSGAPIDLSSLGNLLGSPPQEFFDFIVDASVSVSGTSAKPDFGLVASVDDMAIASARIEKVTALLQTLSQFGGGVTFTDEEHGAATVTVITFSAPGTQGSATTLAMSLSNGRLLLGTHDFVTNTLDRTRDQSLAARPEYQAALDAGGTSNAGVVFVDIAALRTAYEDMVPTDASGDYNLNAQPFLEPLSNVSVVSVTDGNTLVSHVFLYVK